LFLRQEQEEFSVEVDHVVITKRNIYLIETKYKSGTIVADADAPVWTVRAAHGQTTMRNALTQCKNACRVLQQQFDLPCAPIPLVAIQGKELVLVGQPGNVLQADLVIAAIDGFDDHQHEDRLAPKTIAANFAPHIAADAGARKRHVARAESARYKAGMADIVKTASLHSR
jgi:hypothetical protein